MALEVVEHHLITSWYWTTSSASNWCNIFLDSWKKTSLMATGQCQPELDLTNYRPKSQSMNQYQANSNADSGSATQYMEHLLQKVREPLADYQEKRGLPKTDSYGFTNLATSLCQHSYNAILTIFGMLWNLQPLLEGFLYLTRFILDKLIEICQTEETPKMVLKTSVFVVELLVIVIMVMTICGFILIPVWQMLSYVVKKMWYMF